MVRSDWQKAENYDYVDELSPSALAFEFLRRNPDYQADYKEYTTKIERLFNKYGSSEDTEKQVRADTSFWKLQPENKEGELLDDWKRRTMLGDQCPKPTPIEYWYGEKWRLIRAFPDPSKRAHNDIQFKPYVPYPEMPMFEGIKSYFADEEPFPQQLGTAVLAFNLQFDLTKQIDSARILLTSLKKALEKDGWIMFKLGINKPSKFDERIKEYLRAFDGDISGAKPIEIGNVLFPELPNTVNDNYERSETASARIDQAKNIVERTYQIIPFLHSS